jgi:hypothetical protein
MYWLFICAGYAFNTPIADPNGSSRNTTRVRLVMADEDDSAIVLGLLKPSGHKPLHGVRRLFIERGRGLVEEKNIGIKLYGSHERGDLSFAA